VPRQRISIFQGEEGGGKTLLLLQLIASVQRSGGRAAFVDAEHALTPGFARLLGVDYDKLVISRPRTLNQCYDVARPLASSGLFDVVGFDSAVALATKDEIEASADSGGKRAAKAQVHAEELSKLVSTVHERTAVGIINQLRENPNPPGWWNGGKLLYSPGGRALRHHASLVVDVKQGQTHKRGGIRVGHTVRTYISKNKVAVPYRRSEFTLMYETGVDLLTDALTSAIDSGIVEKRGSWLYFDEIDGDGVVVKEHKWLGGESFEEAVRASEELQRQIFWRLGDADVDVDADNEPSESRESSGWDAV